MVLEVGMNTGLCHGKHAIRRRLVLPLRIRERSLAFLWLLQPPIVTASPQPSSRWSSQRARRNGWRPGSSACRAKCVMRVLTAKGAGVRCHARSVRVARAPATSVHAALSPSHRLDTNTGRAAGGAAHWSVSLHLTLLSGPCPRSVVVHTLGREHVGCSHARSVAG